MAERRLERLKATGRHGSQAERDANEREEAVLAKLHEGLQAGTPIRDLGLERNAWELDSAGYTVLLPEQLGVPELVDRMRQVILDRSAEELPPEPKEIKPHPYGVELGRLVTMLQEHPKATLAQFLVASFSRVSSGVARRICDSAKLSTRATCAKLGRGEADALYRAIQETKIPPPATDCIVPIGEQRLQHLGNLVRLDVSRQLRVDVEALGALDRDLVFRELVFGRTRRSEEHTSELQSH